MNKRPIVNIVFDGYRNIKIELYPEHAKESVNNFIDLINNGYFNNMAICRIVNNRLIQSGDPSLIFKKRIDSSPGYILDGEFNRDDVVNKLSFKRGTLGMAMAAYEYTPYASAGSFFIMTRDEEKLDFICPAFGRVIEGMDEVDKINSLVTSNKCGYDAPEDVINILSISVETFGIEYDVPKTV